MKDLRCNAFATASLRESAALCRRGAHGTAASSGCAQCHIHTGYSTSCAPVRADRDRRGPPDRFVVGMTVAAPRRRAPGSGGPGRENLGQHVGQLGPRGRRSRPSGKPSDIGVRQTEGVDGTVRSSARRSVFEPAALQRREIRVRRPAVACGHHLNAHTHVRPASRPSHRSRTSRRRDALPPRRFRGKRTGQARGSSRRASSQTCAGVPPPDNGRAANRAALLTEGRPGGASSSLPRQAAQLLEVAFGVALSDVDRSGRPPAARARHPGTAARARAHAPCD